MRTVSTGQKAGSGRRRGDARVALTALCAPAVAFFSLLIFAYNPEQDNVGGTPVAARWQNDGGVNVTWNLNPTVGSNVDTSGGPVGTAVTNAFNRWQQTQLNGQVVNNLAVTQGIDSSLTDPNNADCLNVISFVPSSSVHFATGTIAFTDLVTSFGPPGGTYRCTTPPMTRVCNLPSCIIDADIVFNPAENFSTATPTPASRFDVQSIATHEIGHMVGLDHSGIAHAVMFPFGDTRAAGQQRNLAVDDVVGIAFLYPASNFATATGTISGTINQNGSGIFASHVIAIDVTTGNAVVDGLTNTDGTYRLVGVPPGTYNVLALPLAGVYTVGNFDGWICGYATDAQNCRGIPSNPTNYTGKFF